MPNSKIFILILFVMVAVPTVTNAQQLSEVKLDSLKRVAQQRDSLLAVQDSLLHAGRRAANFREAVQETTIDPRRISWLYLARLDSAKVRPAKRQRQADEPDWLTWLGMPPLPVKAQKKADAPSDTTYFFWSRLRAGQVTATRLGSTYWVTEGDAFKASSQEGIKLTLLKPKPQDAKPLPGLVFAGIKFWPSHWRKITPFEWGISYLSEGRNLYLVLKVEVPRP